MGCVVRKQRKTLLSRILRKLKTELSSHEQRTISEDVFLEATRVNDVDNTAIESRRNDIRAVKHGNSDVIIVSECSN